MCGQRGVKGKLKGKFAIEEEKNILPGERYIELARELKGKTNVFYLWGGEPLTYPGFMDLVPELLKHIPLVAVNTNGTKLAENAERIVRDQWTTIFVSLDSFEDINDKIRGKGSYKKVMAGLEALKREKEKQKSMLPHISVVTVVNNLNYLYLDKLAESLADKGLSWHYINLGTYMNDEIGKEHVKFMKDRLDIDATYWDGYNTGFNEGIDGDKFQEILSRVHKIDNGYPIVTVPLIRPSKIGTFYSELLTIVRDRCPNPWFSVNIHYDGNVGFCADYPEYSVGNIKDKPLLELYNNERAINFRKELKNSSRGLFPACKRCYQNMLFGHRVKGY
jgi:radical SAM protein with 4Fe4S-binding SPASM domain